MFVTYRYLVVYVLTFVLCVASGCSSMRIVEVDDGSDNHTTTAQEKKHQTLSADRKDAKKTPEARPAGSIESAVLFINNDHITADEVLTRVLPSIKSYASHYDESAFYPKSVELVSKTITDMVSELLLYQEISSRLTDEQNPAVEKTVDQAVGNMVQRQADGSMMLFEKQLEKDGMDINSLRERLKKQILSQQYLRDKLKPRVVITRDELWNYYEAHKKDYFIPAKIHMYLIEIASDKFLPEGVSFAQADDDQKEMAKQIAERKVNLVKKRLAAGEEFTTVAKELSTAASGKFGGDMGWVTRGSYKIKKIEDAAFDLLPGDVSSPITIDRKTYIVKLAGKKESKIISFCEAQTQIRKKLEQKLYSDLVNTHLLSLWKKSQIGAIKPFARIVISRLPNYRKLKNSN